MPRVLSIVSVAFLTAFGAGFFGSGANAQEIVDLEYQVLDPVVTVGDTFSIDLIARSGTVFDVPMSGLTVILGWDPGKLQLEGVVPNPLSGMLSSFPDDSFFDNLNETFLDGDAFFMAQTQFPRPPPPRAVASAEGLLVSSFLFRALEPTPQTSIRMPLDISPATETSVISGTVPGLDILRARDQVSIAVAVPEPTTAALLLLASFGWFGRRKA